MPVGVVCIPVNVRVLCAYIPVGKSPTIGATLLVSPGVRQGAWVGGLGNSGLILGSCQVNYGLCSQVPQSREQVVPGRPFFIPGQYRGQILGWNQPTFLLALLCCLYHSTS